MPNSPKKRRHHCCLQSQMYIYQNTLVSFYCTETQGIAGCDTVSAVVAFALTRKFCASSLGKLLILPYLFCAVLQAHTSLANATLMSLPQQQIKHQDVAHVIPLHPSSIHSSRIKSQSCTCVWSRMWQYIPPSHAAVLCPLDL